MKYFYPILFFICSFPATIFAQVDSVTQQTDSVIRKDTPRKDTARLRPRPPRIKDSARIKDKLVLQADSIRIQDSLRVQDSLRSVAADSLRKKSIERTPEILKAGDKKIFYGKELLFYYLIFLLILFGLLRRTFAKYFHDLFRVFFKTTLKQRQTQEQLLQSPLPSVFMNSFFILSAGLYANFVLQHFELSIAANFWLQYLYCAGALASIYIVKFVGLKLAGWLFSVSGATDSYIFIVFIINKMVGIFFLPFLVLLAFVDEPLYSMAMVFSWFGVGLLLIYRFILSYRAVRKEVKLNSFHFVLYIVAFEIVPLLLIYKLLLLIF